VKLTTAARRRITADWLKEFPDLGEYKPLWMLRRVGPLLEGIVLDRTSSNDEYRPTFHVHCLLKDFSDVTLTLAHPLLTERTRSPESVSVLYHDKRCVDAARTLERQSPLALAGDLRLSDVVEAYRRFAYRPGIHYDAHLLYADMAKLCAWFDDRDQASAVIAEGAAIVEGWPLAIRSEIGGVESWRSQLENAVADRKGQRELMDRQVQELELQKLPVASMIV
jgi:hypothetical protein